MRGFFLLFSLLFSLLAFSADLYYCPMHCEGAKTYDVEGRCPVCGMNLDKKSESVEGPMNSRTYRVDLKVGSPQAGARTTLTLSLRQTKDDSPVKELEIVHEKPLHLIIVSQDLAFFAHEHPVIVAPGELKIDFTFPHGGNYVLYADFTPKGGKGQVFPLALQVAGKKVSEKPLKESRGAVQIQGYSIGLSTDSPLAAGKGAILNFRVQKKGKPVSDLTPYLGAGGHLVVVSEDTTRFLHAHPVEAGASAHPAAEGAHTAHQGHGAATTGYGPVLSFGTLFPKGGKYKAWLQFQHLGKVVTADFTLSVKN